MSTTVSLRLPRRETSSPRRRRPCGFPRRRSATCKRAHTELRPRTPAGDCGAPTGLTRGDGRMKWAAGRCSRTPCASRVKHSLLPVEQRPLSGACRTSWPGCRSPGRPYAPAFGVSDRRCSRIAALRLRPLAEDLTVPTGPASGRPYSGRARRCAGRQPRLRFEGLTSEPASGRPSIRDC